MGSLHKGGIVFDYWVHNPWHGRLSLDVPAPEVQIVPAVACITPRVKDRVDDDDDFNDQSGDDCEEEDYANTPSDEDSGDEYDPQPTPPPRHRRIVEFCTSNDSRIGKMAPPNCEVVRLTIDDDLTSDEGLAKALAAVSDPSFQVLLFGALPCTGGSQWQNYNWKRGPDTQDKIRGHWEVFEVLFGNFMVVAAACRQNYGHIAMEWPRACSYWTRPSVLNFVRLNNLVDYDFDGCMYGLCSVVEATLGEPIKKPWRIASDMPEFEMLRRQCTHTPTEHAQCAGKDTKLSEGYTDALARSIHACFALHGCRLGPGGTALAQDISDSPCSEFVVDA
jgi:hypothetical protein